MSTKLYCPRCSAEASLERMRTRRPCYTISCDSPFCDNRITMAVTYAAYYPGVMTITEVEERKAKAELIAAWNKLKSDPAYTGEAHKTYRYFTSFKISHPGSTAQ